MGTPEIIGMILFFISLITNIFYIFGGINILKCKHDYNSSMICCKCWYHYNGDTTICNIFFLTMVNVGICYLLFKYYTI